MSDAWRGVIFDYRDCFTKRCALLPLKKRDVHRLVAGCSSSEYFVGNEELTRMAPVALRRYKFSHIWTNHQGPPKVVISSLADNFTSTWWRGEYTDPNRCFPKGTCPPVANVSAMACIFVVGPQVFLQKTNLSSHIFKKATCSLGKIVPVLLCSRT